MRDFGQHPKLLDPEILEDAGKAFCMVQIIPSEKTPGRRAAWDPADDRRPLEHRQLRSCLMGRGTKGAASALSNTARIGSTS